MQKLLGAFSGAGGRWQEPTGPRPLHRGKSESQAVCERKAGMKIATKLQNMCEPVLMTLKE